MPTTTTNLAMTKPDAGQSNWAGLMNANLDILDSKFPGGLAGISSIGLSLPGEFSISGSPLIANGTITGSWVSQAANKVFAAPSGSSGTPGFRVLVASDIPALAYVTSVGLTVPSWYSITGSPVTGSGTLAITAASGQTQNQFLATPNGSTGAVGLRSIVAADIPTLSYLPSGGGTLSGPLLLPTGTKTNPSVAFAGSTGTGIYEGGTNTLLFTVTGAARANLSSAAFLLDSGWQLAWSSGLVDAAGADTVLLREAADTLALRRGTNTQTFNLYGKYTDASNWERLRVSYDGVTQHRPTFVAEKLGTGVCNGIDIAIPSGTNIRCSIGGANQFFIGGSGCSFYNGTGTVAMGLPPIYGTQSLTGQVASLGATTVLSVPAAGLYRLSFSAATTTSGTGTTATVTVSWNDGNAKSVTSASFALNAVDSTGQVNGIIVLRSAVSTTIQIATTVGSIGTSVYRIDAVAERLQ